MSGQPIVLTVELFLDNVVPFPQAIYQRLVVGNKELDVLPILACLLFETVALKIVMDMVIYRTIFFELLVFFTFTFLTLHFDY